MSSSVQVAFDLGAESGRAVVGSFDGDRVELAEAHRFANRPVRLPDGLYWDALGLHTEICEALGGQKASGASVRSIGIDSWGCDFGLLDRDGTLLSNPLHHRDGRGAGAMETAFARLAADEIYETTGIQFLPFNTVFQLVALEGTPVLGAAETLLLIPDLLDYWLTGERVTEATNASTTQLLDVDSGRFSSSLMSRLGIRETLFPDLVQPGHVVGGLLRGVAETTGLARATPVVSVASHDTASAVVAAPFQRGTSAAFISSGTWSLVGVELDHPVVSEAARAANLTNERGYGGSIRLLKNVMGLWLAQECRRAWAAEGPAPTYADLAELAETAAAGGPLFDPDLPRLMTPGDMPVRIREACEQCGEAAPADRAALIRSVFESLACKYRVVLEEIECVTETAIEVVHVIGGGARNEFLCRLTANVSRRPVLAGPVEAAALGNILVQLYAFDQLGSLDEMRRVVRTSTDVRAYEPDADGAWDALYERFLGIVGPRLLEEGIAR